jgi:hypothetical protein
MHMIKSFEVSPIRIINMDINVLCLHWLGGPVFDLKSLRNRSVLLTRGVYGQAI